MIHQPAPAHSRCFGIYSLGSPMPADQTAGPATALPHPKKKRCYLPLVLREKAELLAQTAQHTARGQDTGRRDLHLRFSSHPRPPCREVLFKQRRALNSFLARPPHFSAVTTHNNH